MKPIVWTFKVDETMVREQPSLAPLLGRTVASWIDAAGHVHTVVGFSSD